MAMYRFTLGIGISNAVQEDSLDIPDEEIDECADQHELEELINNYWSDWSSNYIDGGCYPVKEHDLL